MDLAFPARWFAIKLLEGDQEVIRIVEKKKPSILKLVSKYSRELEKIHGEPANVVISSERYSIAARITSKVIKRSKYKETISDKLDKITTNKFAGYIIMFLAMGLTLFTIFYLGSWLSDWLVNLLSVIQEPLKNTIRDPFLFSLVWSTVDGLIAGVAIVLPYIIPFYIILSFVEDSGYLARVAFLTDSLMHKIGLHGKAFIPMVLGFGCNVPACLGCRIMERPREKFITAFLVTLVPCAARTVIILGLVAAFLGFQWAVALYIIDFIIILLIGKLLNKFMPGEPVGLIMEMPPYRLPSIKVALRSSWARVKEFIKIAFPLIIASSFVIEFLRQIGVLGEFSAVISPITVGWLGLPQAAGILLIFGILRKELVLVMLASVLGTTNFATALTQLQMFTLALVSMLYVPCIATIAALKREFGWKKALYIAVFEIVFAILVGGILMRVLAPLLA